MIICAAIKTHKGEIISGHRHPDCIRTMAQSGNYKLPVTKDAVQGFLDDQGNFLNRQEARQHFIDCNQVGCPGGSKLHPTDLFSEDLY